MVNVVRILMVGIVVSLWCSSNAFAKSYEYSDAPSQYGTARHVTGEWQHLGNTWSAERRPLRTDRDASDDGVSWSSDGGKHFNNADIVKGQNVTFRFDVHRAS